MTAKPILLVTRKLPAAVLERAARDYDARINHADEVYGPDEVIARAEGCDAILICSTEKISAEVVERLPASVRAVATFSVGTEHLDLEAAKKRGLVMTNTPDVLTDSTADITFLVLLGAARRASEGQQMVRENKWIGWNPNQLLGVHVSGKKLGILGMGRIGRAVARRARGVDLAIPDHHRSPPDPAWGAGTGGAWGRWRSKSRTARGGRRWWPPAAWSCARRTRHPPRPARESRSSVSERRINELALRRASARRRMRRFDEISSKWGLTRFANATRTCVLVSLLF